MRLRLAFLLSGWACVAGQGPVPGNATSPRAVQEVLAGKRAVANAAWWGFNPEDSTEALQAAIQSGARRVIVPNMTKVWVVRPIQLAGNQELVLEDGVVITAKRGEYRGKGDSVFRATDLANLTIRGYGATIRMQKEDYIVGKVLVDFKWHRWFGQYEKAEWRMPLVIAGSSNITVSGVTLRDSGGDGIMVIGTGKQRHSRNIHIRDVVCDNNYRTSISIISVDGLLVENSVFKNTWGTPPSSGVDIEPDSPDERVRNVVFRNCRFEDNYGDGIEIFLANLKKEKSGDVSILFDNCRVTSSRGAGIRVTKIADDGPGGLIEFRNCVIEHTEGYGIKVQDKSAAAARVRFVDCAVRNARRNRMYGAAWAPIWFHLPNEKFTKRLGGVDFVNCVLEDDHDRPAVFADASSRELSLVDVKGDIQVTNPFGAKAELKMNQEGVALAVKDRTETGMERAVEHVLVYQEPGRFGGWPANHGLWSWGDEILVGFSAAWFKRRPDDRHQVDPDKPEEPRLARSLDGGHTWRIEAPRSLLPPEQGGSQPVDLAEAMNFTHPGFAMTIRLTDIHRGASRLFFTLDRGKTWKGPFRLPLFGQLGIAGRTDYIINGKHDALVFLTASKSNGREGRPLCIRTRDGGLSWQFVSWIGPEPEGFSIMPSTVRLSPTSLLTTVRRKEGATQEARDWIDAYSSEDNGGSWRYLSRPAPLTGGFSGNPPSLVRLRDGRLALTYGFRGKPYGIRARLSSDKGKSWGDEIVLRDDGAAWDLGYTRSVQRLDGKVVTVYYFADAKDTERVIRATIWDPGEAGR